MFSAKLLIGSLMLFGSLARAGLVTDCFDCGKAARNECVAARGMVPPSGPADGNESSRYASVACKMGYYPKGISPDFAAISIAAQSLIDKCCTGQSECAGVAYETGDSNTLQDGCVCMGAGPCQCGGGTPSSVCQ